MPVQELSSPRPGGPEQHLLGRALLVDQAVAQEDHPVRSGSPARCWRAPSGPRGQELPVLLEGRLDGAQFVLRGQQGNRRCSLVLARASG